METRNLLKIAFDYWQMGISVIPVLRYSKAAARPWKYFQEYLPTLEDFFTWFVKAGFINYGVICGPLKGKPGNLVVIDFDNLALGYQWLESMPLQTYMVLTARGLHAYYITDEPALPGHYEGMDLKANGYVLGVGSIHPSGAVYQVALNSPIAKITRIEDTLPARFLVGKQPGESMPARSIPSPLLSRQPSKSPDVWDEVNRGKEPLVTTLKRRFSILDFLEGAIQSDSSGRWYMALCPFHDDKNPSMWVDTGRGVCGCLAGCTPKPMDVINLYGRLRGIGNKKALLELQELL